MFFFVMYIVFLREIGCGFEIKLFHKLSDG